MNIKEHIEQGHYPVDEKGRPLVPGTGNAVWAILCVDRPTNEGQPHPIIAFRCPDGQLCSFPADDGVDGGLLYRLLPPPPRKVRLEAWAQVVDGKIAKITADPKDGAYWSNPPARPWVCVKLTAEIEEPWS